jgi:isoleucyl-tRNA synthetase
VAQVEIADAVVTEGNVEKGAFYVQAKPAKGSKCERCWRFTEDVGDDARYPTVCLRCADALDAIQFPPYTEPPSTEPAA